MKWDIFKYLIKVRKREYAILLNQDMNYKHFLSFLDDHILKTEKLLILLTL